VHRRVLVGLSGAALVAVVGVGVLLTGHAGASGISYLNDPAANSRAQRAADDLVAILMKADDSSFRANYDESEIVRSGLRVTFGPGASLRLLRAVPRQVDGVPISVVRSAMSKADVERWMSEIGRDDGYWRQRHVNITRIAPDYRRGVLLVSVEHYTHRVAHSIEARYRPHVIVARYDEPPGQLD
jgi:hypothetical protein